jgi:hypothetical protein
VLRRSAGIDEEVDIHFKTLSEFLLFRVYPVASVKLHVMEMNGIVTHQAFLMSVAARGT